MPLIIAPKLERPEGLSQRKHNQNMNAVNRAAMETIRDEYWPRHFERNSDTSPGGGYGYAARSRVWQIYKARKKGHQKPNVFSGRLRAEVLWNAKITATATRGRIKARSYFPLTAQRRAELEAVTPREQAQLAGMAGSLYAEAAAKQTAPRARNARGQFIGAS